MRVSGTKVNAPTHNATTQIVGNLVRTRTIYDDNNGTYEMSQTGNRGNLAPLMLARNDGENAGREPDRCASDPQNAIY